MFKHIVFRVLAALVLLAAITGIAVFAFNAGMTRGAVMTLPAPAAGQPAPYPMPYAYGYGMPFMHPFFGFGCFGLLLPIFLLFLAFGAARHMIWGPRMGWRHMRHGMHHGEWGEKGPGSPDFVPPMFAEMHRRMHAAEQPSTPDEKPAQ